MRKWFLLFLVMVLTLFLVSPVNALIIETSASGAMNGADYGYAFTISDNDDVSAGIFSATLTNISDDALIDRLLFNMDAELGTDFNIANVSPDWTFYAGSAPIQFDYIGDADTPGDRIAPSGTLTFDFVFSSEFSLGEDPFAIWTGTSASLGVGTGGGEDFGQVAVSFQGIGGGEFSNDSDLLASNWSAQPVPEPSTIVLLGLGLVGLAGVGRKKIRH